MTPVKERQIRLFYLGGGSVLRKDDNCFYLLWIPWYPSLQTELKLKPNAFGHLLSLWKMRLKAKHGK